MSPGFCSFFVMTVLIINTFDWSRGEQCNFVSRESHLDSFDVNVARSWHLAVNSFIARCHVTMN